MPAKRVCVCHSESACLIAKYLCCRKKNVIVVRGFNVYPEEVEACILSSLLAQDCLVYGEMDEKGNETVCVDIVPSPSLNCLSNLESEIRAYCKTHLSAFKQPRKIRIIEAIKKTLSGKNQIAKGEQP
ncbi:MAG: class I adenylate-forming enzyme family protein [Bacillota bacterium]|jgi:long-chain acyl-CoA synthetase|nr:class I adenylate-forming enzyme family protein [Bacillota bacterium]